MCRAARRPRDSARTPVQTRGRGGGCVQVSLRLTFPVNRTYYVLLIVTVRAPGPRILHRPFIHAFQCMTLLRAGPSTPLHRPALTPPRPHPHLSLQPTLFLKPHPCAHKPNGLCKQMGLTKETCLEAPQGPLAVLRITDRGRVGGPKGRLAGAGPTPWAEVGLLGGTCVTSAPWAGASGTSRLAEHPGLGFLVCNLGSSGLLPRVPRCASAQKVLKQEWKLPDGSQSLP